MTGISIVKPLFFGKPLQQILDLMKKETWLTGEQAVELGFVDELFHPKGKTDPVKNESLHAFVNYSDLPDLPTIQDQDPIHGQTLEISDGPTSKRRLPHPANNH